MAIQGSSCGDKTKIDFNKIMDESSEESKENKVDSSSSDELTNDELHALEEEIAKVTTPQQKAHAMRILRGFGKGTTEAQKNEAMVSAIIKLDKLLKFDSSLSNSSMN